MPTKPGDYATFHEVAIRFIDEETAEAALKAIQSAPYCGQEHAEQREVSL